MVAVPPDPAAPLTAGLLTAGIVVIGDEILSGRTRDTNSGHIAGRLTEVGIDLREVRVVPDDQPMIVEAVNTLRERYSYVFTCGGIGPTHDDITADAIAAAFGVGIGIDAGARATLAAHYGSEEALTPSRLRMARIPHGASLVDNPVSGAPGFHIGNVFVMAGVPRIMEAMMDGIIPTLEPGVKVESRTVVCHVGESLIAEDLGALQANNPMVSLGSYPFNDEGRWATRLVVRARDLNALARVESDLEQLVARHEATAAQGTL